VPGRDLLRDDAGRDEGNAGSSEGKKPDFCLRGDGEGGIWARVSIVLSDREGRGRRGSVRALAEYSTSFRPKSAVPDPALFPLLVV
jgi:hypothetical protein